MACSRRHKSPARCNGFPPDEGLVTKVTGSDAPTPDTPIGRTCLRGTQTRRPRRREHHQTAGRIKRRGWRRIANDPTSSPGRGSRSAWCTIRREPPGPPARLWQTFPREDSVAAGPAPGHSWNASSKDRRRLARETHAAGKNAERGAGRSHIKILRQVASGASSDPSGQARGQVSNHPEGIDPDRRRSLRFLTSTDHPHPEVPDTVGPRRARPPVHQEGCFEARASRGHLSMREPKRLRGHISPLVGEMG